MPPRTNSRGATPVRPTPARTGLRSQTPRSNASQEPAAIPLESNANTTDNQSERPDIQPRTSNAYGGPSRSLIASDTVAAAGQNDVANVFNSALTSAVGRVETDETNDAANDTNDAADAQESPTVTARSSNRPSGVRSASADRSDAGSVASSTNSRGTRRSARVSQRTQGTSLMPSIAEGTDSPGHATVQTTGNADTQGNHAAQITSNANIPGDSTVQTTSDDTTQLDWAGAPSFATPSRSRFFAGHRQNNDDTDSSKSSSSSSSPSSRPADTSRRSSPVRTPRRPSKSSEKQGEGLADLMETLRANNGNIRAEPRRAENEPKYPPLAAQQPNPEPHQAQPEIVQPQLEDQQQLPPQVPDDAAHVAAHRPQQSVFTVTHMVIILVLIICWQFGAWLFEQTPNSFTRGVSDRVQITKSALSYHANVAKYGIYSYIASYAPRDKDGAISDPRLEGRVDSLENKMHAMENKVNILGTQMDMVIKNVNLHEATMKSLEEALPQSLIVRRTKHGELQIPDEFWSAVQARLERDDRGAWQKFLLKNFRKVNEYGDKRTGYHNDQDFQAWKAEHYVLDKKEFQKLLNDNYAELSANYEKKLRDIRGHVNTMSISTGLIHRIPDPDDPLSVDWPANDRTAKIAQVQLTALARTNLARNAEIHLHKHNYFAPSLGASVIPFQSSPTADKAALSLPHRSFFQVFKGYAPNPPIMALEPWSEPKDCWCAAPASAAEKSEEAPNAADRHQHHSGAKAAHLQLAVKMARPIYPTEITIEHFPPRGNLVSSSMPKDMEVWMRVTDPKKHARVYEDSQVTFRDWLERPPRVPPKADNGMELGPEWIKVAMFKYEKLGHNHVQTFALDVHPGKHATNITETVLRATSNYGGDTTCLYRVRLHGALAPQQ